MKTTHFNVLVQREDDWYVVLYSLAKASYTMPEVFKQYQWKFTAIFR